jgi:hypothetical protein
MAGTGAFFLVSEHQVASMREWPNLWIAARGEEPVMRRSITIFSVTLALAFTSAVAAVAGEKAASGKGKGKELIKCAITHQEVEKSKAIAVKTMSGKTVYVCCKGCVAAAKQLK